MMNDKEVRESNKRILRFAIATFICVALMGASGFLLILALFKGWDGDLSILVEEHPRVYIIAIAAVLIILILIIGFFSYLRGKRIDTKGREI